MKKILFLFLCLLCNKVYGEEKKQIIDGIVLSFNDEILLFSEIQKAVNVYSYAKTQIDNTGKITGDLSVSDVEKIIDDLIMKKIMLMKIKEFQLDVKEKELNEEIEQIAKQNSLTLEDMKSEIKKQGMNYEEYKEEVKNQLESKKFVGNIIRAKIAVSEEEVKAFYLQQNNIKEKSQKIRLKSLIINNDDSFSQIKKDRINKNIKEITDNIISKSEDFSRLIKMYSDNVSTDELPPKDLASLPKELKEKINNNIKENDIVGPLKIGSSVFFFQYLGSIFDDGGNFIKEKEKWTNQLYNIKMQEAIADYLKIEKTKMKIQYKNFNLTK